MIAYEAYNERIRVQFATLQAADTYALENNLQVRELEVVEPQQTPEEPTKDDWLNLEQDLYDNEAIFGKAINSTGNGFTFLLKVFVDGKTTYAHQNALLSAINMLMPAMAVPYTQEEIAYINSKFAKHNFSISINI